MPGAKRSGAPVSNGLGLRSAQPPATRPRGFTLIEVLLTLLLISLVLAALAMAVDFQLRVVERSRGHVEEAQLARVLLHRIADDLRGAVPYDLLEMEKLVSEAISSAASAATETVASTAEASGSASSDGAAGPSGTEDSTTAGDAPEDLEGLDDMADTTSQAAPDAPQSVPGLYGESNWIQVDVSRLPRLDQFNYLTSSHSSRSSQKGSTTVDRLSDVKTVTYYAIEPEDGEPVYSADGTPSGGGLVRRELDRAVAAWSSEQGGPEAMESDEAPIAPEVAAIEFRYSDGGEWVDSWDSDEAGALPMAVEITLSVIPTRRENDPLSSPQTSTNATVFEEESYLRYRLIVHVLGAQASSGGESSGETEESTEAIEDGESSGSTESTEETGARSSEGESTEEQSR
ncbi:MAG: prepilin-type N-terminal cleavage/methylation domain-containing protein [Planctomycetota bacterium]